MDQFFLGQYLSNRTDGGPRDTTRDKIWAALRYLVVIGFIITMVLLVDDNPGGAFFSALGGAFFASALVNVALIPAADRNDKLNAVWALAGVVLLAVGVTLFAS